MVREVAGRSEELQIEILKRATTDPEFHDRLKADPRGVLAENGLKIPDVVEIRTVQSDANVVYLALPPRPSDELSEEELEQVAGGFCSCCIISCSSCG